LRAGFGCKRLNHTALGALFLSRYPSTGIFFSMAVVSEIGNREHIFFGLIDGFMGKVF
jgi:hypothetical protein